MTDTNLPSVAFLRKVLDYYPATGALTWRERTPDLFRETDIVPRETTCRRWNTKLAGKRADTISGNGYHQVNLSGKCLIAHRVVWAVHYGAWPTSVLDHVNGVRGDNRIANLRTCTPSENSRNQARRANHTSSCTGVHRKGNRWVATIGTDDGRLYLGSYATLDAAMVVRRLAEKQHGYSARHGT